MQFCRDSLVAETWSHEVTFGLLSKLDSMNLYGLLVGNLLRNF